MPDDTERAAEDQFADALDAITLGMPLREGSHSPLADAAWAIGKIGLNPSEAREEGMVTLDRETKRQIWTDLMRQHGGTPEAAPTPKSPGPAGSTLVPNPWVARAGLAKPKRHRSSTSSLRFLPAAQPTSTFLLVVAVIVLVGGTFASLAPNGEGVVPSARATENPAQLAYASPEASPVTEDCTVEAAPDGTAESLPSRMYRNSGYVPDLHEIYVANRWEQIVTCGSFNGVTGGIPQSLMTGRLAAEYQGASPGEPVQTAWVVTDEEADALLGHSLAWHELEEMEGVYTAALETDPGFDGDPLALDADLGVYRGLTDGRVAFYSGAYWLAEDGRIEPVSDPATGTRVTVHIFAQQDRQWLYDETLSLCFGPCEGFETTGAPKPQLTIATPDAGDLQWLTPLTDESCAVSTPEVADAPPTAPPVETDPNDYVPFTEAEMADREAAATTYLRLTSGCNAPGDRSLVAEGGGVILGDPGQAGTTQSQIETARAISNALGYADSIEVLIANPEPLMVEDDEGYVYIQNHHVLLPEDVVQLPDGRLGGMLRVQQVSSDPGLWTLELPVTTLFVTFDRVDGQWVMAESFAICIGECKDFWSATETARHADATPAATQAVSPVATKP